MNKDFISPYAERASLTPGIVFDGKYEIPYLGGTVSEIPYDLVPYEKRNYVEAEHMHETYLHFYMQDTSFSAIMNNPKRYLDKVRPFGGIVSFDRSLYINMPLAVQISNTYFNHLQASCLQYHGIPVIPNVRWSDERSYAFAFDGLDVYGTYCVSTLGCIRTEEFKEHFRKGLQELRERLKPRRILVHGDMPSSVFCVVDDIECIQYQSWTARVKRGL